MTTTTRRNAGAGDGRTGSTTSSLQPQWSDLPDDILGNIRLKVASLRNRVRLAAVCKPWRATMGRLPAPPAAPVLLMSPRIRTGRRKHLCGGGPDDSWVMHIPDNAADKWIIGSHEGGWVAVFNWINYELMIVNLFSGAEAGVCSLRNFITHVILSDDPTSSRGCILATIGIKRISLCKVGCDKWTKHGWDRKEFGNIAFCNGDLYGLTYPGEELIKFKIGTEEDGSPVVISTHHLSIQRQHGPAADTSYIVELHGKLLKATMAHWLPNREPFFKVFELLDADPYETYQHKWTEVTTFGNYALFLGPGKSKAVYVPMDAERRGFERNHIYYSLSGESEPRDEVYSMRSEDGPSMYCRKDPSIGDGLERTRYDVQEYLNTSMWLHPPPL